MSISWPRQTILDLLSIPISLGTVWQQTSSLTPQTRGYFNSQYKELHLHQHDRASESDSRFLLKSVIMSWAKMSQKALFNSTANLSMPVTGPAYIAVQRVAPQSQRDVEPPQKTKSSFSYQARLCQFLSWLREQRMDLLTKPKKEGTRCIHFCDVLDSELDQNTLYFRIQQIGQRCLFRLEFQHVVVLNTISVSRFLIDLVTSHVTLPVHCWRKSLIWPLPWSHHSFKLTNLSLLCLKSLQTWLKMTINLKKEQY